MLAALCDAVKHITASCSGTEDASAIFFFPREFRETGNHQLTRSVEIGIRVQVARWNAVEENIERRSIAMDAVLGVGLTVSMMKDYHAVVNFVLPGSEADALGVHVGALVVAVNDISVNGWTFEQVEDTIRQMVVITNEPAEEMAVDVPEIGDYVVIEFSQRIQEMNVDRNPYRLTRFPSPQGSHLPGVRALLDANDHQHVEHQDELQPQSPQPGTLQRRERSRSFKHFWMSDRSSKSCCGCDQLFTFFRRRHHCRSCGQIFCAQCCARLPQSFGSGSKVDESITRLRKQLVCHNCHRQLREGLEVELAGTSVQLGGVAKPNKATPESKTLLLMPPQIAEALERSTSEVTHYKQLDKGELFDKDEISSDLPRANEQSEKARLKTLFSMFPKVQIVSSVQHLTHQPHLDVGKESKPSGRDGYRRMRTFSEPIAGYGRTSIQKEETLRSLKRWNSMEDIDHSNSHRWSEAKFKQLIAESNAKAREARSVSASRNTMLNRPKAFSGTFEEARFGSSVRMNPFKGLANTDAQRLKTRSSGSSQDANTLAARETGILAVIGLSEDARDDSTDAEWTKRKEDAIKKMTDQARNRIEERIFHLLDRSSALSELPILEQHKWMQIINLFTHRAALSISCEPDVGDSMDIMEYVQIKCLEGGRVQDSFYIDGVLVHKSVARKGMRSDILKPRILLLASDLDYQRKKEGISSLESVAGQEVEYMHIVAEKIMTLRPDIVLFSGHVHRVAEELLFKNKVAVVKNVRMVDLQRIARSTGASLLTSYDHVDKISDNGVIGTCKRFYVMISDQAPKSAKRMNFKMDADGTFDVVDANNQVLQRKRRPQRQNIVFEGGISSKGCTLCLRGGSQEVFNEVSNVLRATIRAAYNMRLQRAVLTEYGYIPPNEEVDRSVAEEWFAKSSTSLYVSLKSNSLSMRAALKETQSMCKWCKAHTRYNNISSLRGMRGTEVISNPTFRPGVSQSWKSSEITSCTCGSRSSEALRDRILFSCCWSSIEGKTASKAEMMCIDFYSPNDCSLGQFLDKYCFSTSDREFKRAFTISKLSFSHDTGCVTIRVKDLSEFKDQSDRQIPAADLLRDINHRAVLRLIRSDKVVMWSRSLNADPRSRLSMQYTIVPPDVWNYSFGKFLEDMFYGKSLEIDGVRFPHLYGLQSRDSSLVHYFSRQGRVVSVRCEPVEPVLHVALQPVLWQDHIDHEQQIAAIRELCDFAHEVYAMTTAKVAESMADLVTPLHVKHNLKILRNEVQQWYSCFASKLESNPPQDIFEKNAHCKEIYARAVGWSLRITQAMQATVKPTVKHAINSPKSALPRAWFDQLTQASGSNDKDSITSESPAGSYQDAMGGMAGNLETLAKFARSLASGEANSPLGFSNFTNEASNHWKYNGSDLPEGWNWEENIDSTSQSFPANESSDSDSYATNNAATIGSLSSKKALEAFRRTYQLKKSDGLGYLTIPKRLLACHPNLPSGVRDTVVLVNSSQPTSVVAYSLCSHEYTKRVNSYIRKAFSSTDDVVLTAVLLETKNTGTTSAGSSELGMLRMLRSTMRNNVDHVFVDENQFQPATRFSCKAYYAMQFHALRRLYYGGDRNYVESLCHCEQWNVAGGKSGAGFLKTRDQRFIAKAIPEIELQMFLSMANEYFCYMAKTFENNLSSMLSKVLGIYKVSISSATQNDVDQKMCVIVMENLNYGREVNFSFDLKGKMEGRYKERNGDDSGGPVLWDRNFVEMAGGIPLPLQESAMSLLLAAIVNDTGFLASVQVTDYSMLVGYDVNRQEVVASIIDYIHKYDFMKMVEHAGKRLIQDEGEITILNPKHYRKRFCQAMTKYFVSIPSRYTKVTTVVRNLKPANSNTVMGGADEEIEMSPPASTSLARRISVTKA